MPTLSSPPVSSRISPWFRAIAYPLGHHLVMPYYFSAIEIHGQDNIPRTGPVILAPTHRSRWDALLVPYATGRNITGRYLRFMVSADEMRGLQGWVIRRLGCFPVNTRRVKSATLTHGVELLQREEMLVIFPEGNIYRQPQVARLKRGLATIALQAQARCSPAEPIKIVPISLNYSQPIPRQGCAARVQIGAAIAVSDYAGQSLKTASQALTQDLAQRLQQLQALGQFPAAIESGVC
ncbi:MAG: 1-acyl-sn-glycerol-3-phosphate acyltransferase [Cyanobacteria bacterium P01_G01_bin.54]